MWALSSTRLEGGETYTYVERDAEGNVVLEEERDYISIATTRPETMLGDGAVGCTPPTPATRPSWASSARSRWVRRAPPPHPDHHRRIPRPDFGSGAVKITGAHDFNDYAVAKRAGNSDVPADGRGRAYARRRHALRRGRRYRPARFARGERTLTEAEVDTINLVPDDLRGRDRFEARRHGGGPGHRRRAGGDDNRDRSATGQGRR